MTQREASLRRPRSVLASSSQTSSSLKQLSPHKANGLNLDEMVGAKNIVHIIEILGVVACAHHFWPKGIIYGEQEDWEKAHRKRHEHGSKSKSKSKRSASCRGSSSNDSHQRSTRDDRRYENEWRYEDEYDGRPRCSRHASSRY